MSRLPVIPALLACWLLGNEPMLSQGADAPVDLRVSVAPAPFVSDGRTRLAYELHVTNFYQRTGTLWLHRLEVFTDGATLAKYDGDGLAERVVHPGAVPPPADPLAIPGGMHAVVYIWITLPAGQRTPGSLRHRLVFRTEKAAEEVVDGFRVDVRKSAVPVLGAPFRNGIWFVANGPGNHRAHHWGGLLASNGHVTIPQRFAMDLMGVDDNGKAVRGDFQKSANKDWVGYGADVVAVADGIVRDVQDGQPEKAPLAPNPPTAPSLQSAGGNYVLLDIGDNVIVFYAHLQPNSLTVKTGDRVRRGQLLGRLGNSGSTTAPHLHLHITDTVALEGSEGLPFVFRLFDALGETSAERLIGADASAAPIPLAPKPRERELPLDGALIRFRSTP